MFAPLDRPLLPTIRSNDDDYTRREKNKSLLLSFSHDTTAREEEDAFPDADDSDFAACALSSCLNFPLLFFVLQLLSALLLLIVS